MSLEKEDIIIIERIIGHTFSDKKLLITAFTHSSFSNENNVENNEKLEFLGDSILNFVVSEFLFGNFLDEGRLTTERAKIVSALPLASAIKKLNLIKYMRVGVGVTSNKLSQKFYSNIFEAIVGAMYLDGGFPPCKRFIANNLVLDNFSSVSDYKTMLQEVVQRTHKDNQIEYKDSFDNKEKVFISKVFIVSKEYGTGKGTRKKEAQQNAARAALEVLADGK